MTERRFWVVLALIFAVLGVIQLPFTPARFGGIFFLALCIGCTGQALALHYRAKYRVCAALVTTGRVLFSLFVLSFLLIQAGIIQRGMHADPEAANAAYALVLGALVNPDGRPSAALAARCDTAIDFLNMHPGAQAILCGGQGRNEPRAEAVSMYDYITQRGIAGARLILEDQSTNTIENIKNARDMIGDAVDRVVIITSDYHLPRARRLMAHAGYRPCGIPAPTPYPGQWISVRCREYCSILGLMLSGRW